MHQHGSLTNLKHNHVYGELDDGVSGQSGGTQNTKIYSSVETAVPMNDLITKYTHIDQSSERV